MVTETNEKIARLMDELADEEHFNSTCLDGVRIHKYSKGLRRDPLCYSQGIVLVGQGRKRIYFGGKSYIYDPDHYLVLTVPLAAECEAQGTLLEPLLAMMIDIDLGVLNHIIAEMEAQQSFVHVSKKQQGLFISETSSAIKDATVRLLEALQSPIEAKLIGYGIIKEIIYRVMCSEHAESLYALATKNSNLARIDRALKQMHGNYESAMDVDELAHVVNMSASSFHRAFKEVTATTPIQYLKRIRLDKAKSLLVDQGMRVNEAASKVGYESATQFSREFKRIFGISPVSVISEKSCSYFKTNHSILMR